MAATRRILGLLSAALASGLAAADQPPAEKTSDDSIAAARREFEALKGSRTVAESPRLDIPGIGTPALHLSDDEMSSFLQSQAEQKKKDRAKTMGKSKNWLVDAMNDRKSAGPESQKVEGFGDTDSDGTPKLTSSEGPETPVKAKSADGNAKPPVADNPLTNYMAGWMTSKDYELLKVKPAESLPGVVADRGPALPLPAGGGDYTRGDGFGPLVLPAAPTPSAASEPRANPYLADFGSLSGGEAKTVPGLVAPTPGSSSALPAPPAILPPPKIEPPPPAPAPVNDTLKPSNDRKYFPQLKRF